MKQRALKVAAATFSYGGNGCFASTHPAVMTYLMRITHEMANDRRVEALVHKDFVDTPVTMVRNESVLWARKVGADCLLMIDSDNIPDFHLGEPFAKPFWKTSFDFLYDHWEKGPVAIGAPYCGAPPVENVFAFTWGNFESNDPDHKFQLRQITREEAGNRVGIEPTAALPTGCILWDMRCFELTEPPRHDFVEKYAAPWIEQVRQGKPLFEADVRHLVELIVKAKERREHSWFYYEYETSDNGVCYEDRKGSTEDVTATRDVAMAGLITLGYNPIHVNWDAWAGHVKPKIVGKPHPIRFEAVGEKLRRAAWEGLRGQERITDLDAPGWDTLDWTKAIVLKESSNGGAEKVDSPVVSDSGRPGTENRIAEVLRQMQDA